MNKTFYTLTVFCLFSCAAVDTTPVTKVETKDVISLGQESKTDVEGNIEEDNAVVLLNQIFNSDEENKKLVLIINNDSNCDFVMSVVGEKSYTIPVAANKAETMVVEKGDYVLRSMVCEAQYWSKKTFSENAQVSVKYTAPK